MPTEEDDDNHNEDIPVTTGTAETTTLPPAPQETNTEIGVVPTDHPERPTKPGAGDDQGSNERPTGTGTDASPTDTEAEPATSTDAAPEETTTGESSWLPSFLPTFGVSSRTQAWIYGAFSLIVIFCAALGAWLYIQRRKRLSNSRDNYEFELINEEESEGLNGRGAVAGEKGRKRRGGELYDAFADGTDDEMEMFSDGDDDDSAPAGGSGSGSGRRESDSDDENDEKQPLRSGAAR